MGDEGFVKLLRSCQLPEVLVDSALRDVFSPYRSWIYAVAPAERRHEEVLSPVGRTYRCFGRSVSFVPRSSEARTRLKQMIRSIFIQGPRVFMNTSVGLGASPRKWGVFSFTCRKRNKTGIFCFLLCFLLGRAYQRNFPPSLLSGIHQHRKMHKVRFALRDF